mgnify:CR=1 FL=1
MEITLTITADEETITAFQRHLWIKSTNPPNSVNDVDFTEIQRQLFDQLENVHPIVEVGSTL